MQKQINELDKARLLCLLGELHFTCHTYQPKDKTLYFSNEICTPGTWQVSISDKKVFIAAFALDEKTCFTIAGFCAYVGINWEGE